MSDRSTDGDDGQELRGRCPICDEGVSTRDELVIHLAAAHPGSYRPPRRTGRRGSWVRDALYGLPLFTAAIPALIVAAIYDQAVGFATVESPNPIWGYVTFCLIGVAGLWFFRMSFPDR